MTQAEIAVVGGSGLYSMPELVDVQQLNVETPFGAPSDAITLGKLHGEPVAFLPRHGRGHVLSPSEVPYRANIFALKTLGVRYIIGVSACGSLREDYAPGHIIVPDQLVDNTKGKRQHTFYGNGLVAHVGVAEPFSPQLSKVVADAVRSEGGIVHEGGHYVTIEGPRFSTIGESNLYRQWGMSIVGMTSSPEAFLAAEAEIAYAVMAHVTDYDVWHDTEEPVTVEMVLRRLAANTRLAQLAIGRIVRDKTNWEGEWAVHNAMADAFSLVGDWAGVPQQTKQALRPLLAKYLPADAE